MKPIGCFKFAIYVRVDYETMIATANLLSSLILRSGSDTYVVTKFAIYLGIYQRLSKNALQQATCGHRVLLCVSKSLTLVVITCICYNPMPNC